MCDTCENGKNQILELENREIEAVYFEPLGLSTDNLVDIAGYDSDEFEKGIKLVSKECGMFTAYLGVGMSNIQAYELILTKLTLDHTIEVTKQNNGASIEISKNQAIVSDKVQL